MALIAKTAGVVGNRIAGMASAATAVLLSCVPAFSQEATLELSEVSKRAAEKISSYSGTSNSDQTVRVSGEPLNPVDKQIIMQFAEDVRSRLQMLTDSSFTGDAYRLSIYAENAELDRPCIIEKSLMSPQIGLQSLPTIRISVINPSKMDARDLAREICDGYLSMKVLVCAQGSSHAEPPARWFTAGLSRYLDTLSRQDDAENFLNKWQSAKLPPLWKLVSLN